MSADTAVTETITSAAPAIWTRVRSSSRTTHESAAAITGSAQMTAEALSAEPRRMPEASSASATPVRAPIATA